jgi:hypothetical protein
MIRIDEIYEHTFLPWVRKNLPDTAIYYHDPFGRSDPDSIMCRGLENALDEKNFIYFFDQEPVQPSIHLPTFFDLVMRTRLIPPDRRFLVTSETNSDNVDYICKVNNMQPFYYFFHGWAALDWFRGYDRTFLIEPPEKRNPTKTFFSPNRIIGGERSHRVLMLYHFARLELMHNHISVPEYCPAENISIGEVAKKYKHMYPDMPNIVDLFGGGIEQVIDNMQLPRTFPGENTQRMSSCWLDQFDLCADSMIYHVSETVYFGRRQHLTEKTFKPIALGMPFVLTGPAGSLEYLRSYGFKTFDTVWYELYDNQDDITRAVDIGLLLKNIDSKTEKEKRIIWEKCLPIIDHNWNWFYKGGFEQRLWDELEQMLKNLKSAIQRDLHSN